MVLHAHKARQAVQVGHMLHLGELVGVHAAGPDVAHQSCADQIMESLHGFQDGGVRVEAVNLVQVDVVGTQAFQAGPHPVHDVRPAQTPVIRAAAHRIVNFGGDHHLFTPGKVAHGAAQNLLARAQRVHVSGVKEIDAHIERRADKWPALVLGQHPVAPLWIAVGHGSKRDARDFQAGISQADVFHARRYCAQHGANGKLGLQPPASLQVWERPSTPRATCSAIRLPSSSATRTRSASAWLSRNCRALTSPASSASCNSS